MDKLMNATVSKRLLKFIEGYEQLFLLMGLFSLPLIWYHKSRRKQ